MPPRTNNAGGSKVSKQMLHNAAPIILETIGRNSLGTEDTRNHHNQLMAALQLHVMYHPKASNDRKNMYRPHIFHAARNMVEIGNLASLNKLLRTEKNWASGGFGERNVFDVLATAAALGNPGVFDRLFSFVHRRKIPMTELRKGNLLSKAVGGGSISIVNKVLSTYYTRRTRREQQEIHPVDMSYLLESAARRHYWKIVMRLLDAGFKPRKEVLFLSCQNGGLDVVRRLVKNRLVDVNEIDDRVAWTPLHYAMGQPGIVRYLIGEGKASHLIDKGNPNSLPIHIACRNVGSKYIASAKILLDARPDMRDLLDKPRSVIPLHLATEYNNLPMMELLLARGTPVDIARQGNGNPPRTALMKIGLRYLASPAAVLVLLRHGANVYLSDDILTQILQRIWNWRANTSTVALERNIKNVLDELKRRTTSAFTASTVNADLQVRSLRHAIQYIRDTAAGLRSNVRAAIVSRLKALLQSRIEAIDRARRL